MKSNNWKRITRQIALAASAAIWSCAFASAQGPAAAPAQKTFATPQEAADALIAATTNFDVTALLGLFGPDGKDLVSTADPVQDKNNAEVFAAAARVKHEVVVNPKNPALATLIVGEKDWPFPVPITKTGARWSFNGKDGVRELMYRRIGANELDAIQVCRGFVEAQEEYAWMARAVTGVSQYAQKIISSPGKRDGLYWPKTDGWPDSPISERVAHAIAEGYDLKPGTGYHGYHYKVLKGQGPAARLGKMDYLIEGVMIGGFALLAVPAEYRVTGVKTFMVSYDGVVYQKDLGPDTLKVAESIELYNPDKTWQVTDDEWPPLQASASDAPAKP
jgi:hypothetical protein